MAMVNKILRFEELREHGIVLGRRAIERLEEKGLFPKRVKIGEHRVGWVAAEIEAYIKQQMEKRK